MIRVIREKGDQGDRGEQGLTGPKGDSIKGDKGERGRDGRNGNDGKNGLDGLDGIDGKDGKNGKDGKSIDPKDIKKIAKELNNNNNLFLNIPGVKHVHAGTNISITGTDEDPIINSTGGSGGGQVNTVVAGTGISVNSTDPVNPIITNSAPDQTVSITAGTNITSVTGTYPNFTINAATQTTDISGKQDVDTDLTAISALSTTGISVRTGSGTWATRDMGYPAAGLTITNSAGVAGNPTFALANDLAAVEGLSGTGIANRTGIDTWTTNTLDTDGTLSANSDTTIATQKATKTYADAKVADAINNGTTTIAPSQNAVFDALALKAELAGSTSQAFSVSQLEVGHASDTTITRTGAGAIAVEGVAIATISSTSTITNKRNQPRVVSAASYTTDTGTSLDFSTCDLFVVTAQAGALKFNNPSGTPVHGEKILIRVKDNGTARALTYDTQYRAIGITLPTTTVISKTTYIFGIWNATDSKVDCLATGTEA